MNPAPPKNLPLSLIEAEGCEEYLSIKGDNLDFFYVRVLYSTLLHLPPLRFECVRTLGFNPVATLALAVRFSNNSARGMQ
jgi:hypothetical protein